MNHRQLGATSGTLNPLKVLRGDVEDVPSSGATVTEKISA